MRNFLVRLTPQQMANEYPNQWVFITECVISDDELVSGVVTDHSKSISDLSESLENYKGPSALRFTGQLREGVSFLL